MLYSTMGGTCYTGEVYSPLYQKGSCNLEPELQVIYYRLQESSDKELEDFFVNVNFVSSWAYLKSFRRYLCSRAEWLKSRQPIKPLNKPFTKKKFMKGKGSKSSVWAGSFGSSGLRYRVNKNRKGR